MSVSSPGQANPAWSASLASNDLPIDLFLRSGLNSVPVALVPTNGESIRMKNPKLIQEELRNATPHYQQITEVRQFGRGGILCCSPDQACIADLLKCTIFASHPVSCFVPPHLACVKGLVRGVDSSLTPSEVLDMFSVAGAISVYRCSRSVENSKIPTESVIVTFAGITRPTEIKAWPLIYRVEPLSPRPLQCIKCWRYGHSIKGCRSGVRCRACGEAHDFNVCSTQEVRCCLCSGAHAADNGDCSARAHELQILEIIDQKRCSRREARAVLAERPRGYASAANRFTQGMDSSLSDAIASAVEKSMKKAMENLFVSLTESLAQMVNAQMSQLLQTITRPTEAIPVMPVLPPSEVSHSELPQPGPSKTNLKKIIPVEREQGWSSDSGSLDSQMDFDFRTMKRRASPESQGLSVRLKPKTKKCQKDTTSKKSFLKDSILEKAVISAGISAK